MLKITIDEKSCLKQKLSLTETLLSLAVLEDSDIYKTIDNLIAKGVLVKSENKLEVNSEWKDKLHLLIAGSVGEISDERLLNLATKMQSCFPKGKMKDRYGRDTPYYYRCNSTEIVKKLKKFFTNPNNIKYTDEQIIDATTRFVASFKGNYRYLPLIKYFIFKNKPIEDEDGSTHYVEYSPLADYLENKDDDVPVIADDDWMINTKN